MENQFIDRKILEQFVNLLISQKYQTQSPGDFDSVREEAIAKLDSQIGESILGDLTEKQLDELETLTEYSSDRDTFKQFFEKNDIDLEQKIQTAFEKFRNDFLGGTNA